MKKQIEMKDETYGAQKLIMAHCCSSGLQQKWDCNFYKAPSFIAVSGGQKEERQRKIPKKKKGQHRSKNNNDMMPSPMCTNKIAS